MPTTWTSSWPGIDELFALLDPSGKPVDQMLYFHQLADHSQARLPDGAAHTGYPAYPSPGHYNPLQTSLQQSLVRFDDTWAYQVTGMQPPEEWTGIELDDADWPRGPGVFAAGTGQLPELVRTQLPTGPITYDFRHSFQVPPEWLADGVELTLELRTLIDDGACRSLNGSPVVRLGLPEQVTAATAAQRGIGVADMKVPSLSPAPSYALGQHPGSRSPSSQSVQCGRRYGRVARRLRQRGRSLRRPDGAVAGWTSRHGDHVPSGG